MIPLSSYLVASLFVHDFRSQIISQFWDKRGKWCHMASRYGLDLATLKTDFNMGGLGLCFANGGLGRVDKAALSKDRLRLLNDVNSWGG